MARRITPKRVGNDLDVDRGLGYRRGADPSGAVAAEAVLLVAEVKTLPKLVVTPLAAVRKDQRRWQRPGREGNTGSADGPG